MGPLKILDFLHPEYDLDLSQDLFTYLGQVLPTLENSKVKVGVLRPVQQPALENSEKSVITFSVMANTDRKPDK